LIWLREVNGENSLACGVFISSSPFRVRIDPTVSEAAGVVAALFSMVHMLIFARWYASAFLVSIAARFAV